MNLAEEKLAKVIVGVETGNVSAEGKKALEDAITEAKTDYQAAGSDEAIIKIIINDLSEACIALDKDMETISRSHLSLAIALANEKVEVTYDKNTWVALQAALNVANTVYGNINATFAEINEATNNLNIAIDGLVILNKSYLKTEVDASSSYVEAAYSTDTWLAFVVARDEANVILNSGSVSQKEIDDAISKLTAAINALQKKTDVVIKNDEESIVVSGPIDYDATLDTRIISGNEEQVLLGKIQEKGQLDKYTKIEKILNLRLLKGGVEIQPNGSIKVSIKIDQKLVGKKLGIVYIKEDGTIEKIASSIEDGNIVFTVDHFSYFAIVSFEDAPNVMHGTDAESSTRHKAADTSDSTNIVLYQLMFLLSAGYLAHKKLKKQK